MKNRIISLMLVLVLVFTLLPVYAIADANAETEPKDDPGMTLEQSPDIQALVDQIKKLLNGEQDNGQLKTKLQELLKGLDSKDMSALFKALIKQLPKDQLDKLLGALDDPTLQKIFGMLKSDEAKALVETIKKLIAGEGDAKSICLFEIEAPLVARHAQAGQFVIFRLDEQGERTPVSVAGYDREKGTVTVMVQAAGRTTKMLHTVQEGDYITDFVGPLGKATEMDGLKKVCVVGGGVGCAIAYPIAKEMHEKGIDVTFIAGFRSADIVILKDELKAASDKLIMCTDDGTYGEKGFTTQYLQQEIEANIKENRPQFDRVIAIGPDIMMKFLAEVTRPYGIKTIISLDPIMVDGTGMCGGCRVIVGGETKFACVDGPDFDAHEVDFDSLIKRAAFYKEEQDEAAKHICNMTGGKRNG